MLPEFYQFFLPTKILFQAGIARDFSNELAQLAVKKLFIVCDPFLAKNGTTQLIQAGIEASGVTVVGVYSEVPPNSELSVVETCARLAQERGADGLLALGGGSVMDTAKAADILLSFGGNLVTDYSGSQTLTQAMKPLIAIPTTAGTGSEVTSVAVIYDAKTQTKLSFSDAYLRPQLALLDPELTLTLPPQATAMTGMDALTHAIEALHSVQANPMSEALALAAIRLIHQNLAAAVENGQDLTRRSALLIAANMAGIAFDHAMVGVVHAMAHAAGGVAHVPHGLANSIFLPWGMEYNLASSWSAYAKLAPSLGLVAAGGAEALAKQAITEVRKLREQLKVICGLPDRLRDAGVKEAQLEKIAEAAVADGASFYNPRELEYDDILYKIKEAY